MKNDNTQATSAKRTGLDYYHIQTQFRFDSWHKLAEHTTRLSAKKQRQQETTTLAEKTFALLSILQTVEEYTAFPSDDDFGLLWRLFRKGDYATLSWYVEIIVRALSSGSYRLRGIDLNSALDLKQEEQCGYQKYKKEQSPCHQKPYFELDFLIDLDNDELYLGEINPRVTGASSMTNYAAFAHVDAPLFI